MCFALMLHMPHMRAHVYCHPAGFARPQPPRGAPSPRQQQQQYGRPGPPPPHRPQVKGVSWADADQADALLAGVRARHAGLVEQQLSHLILTKALTQEDVWAQACKVCEGKMGGKERRRGLVFSKCVCVGGGVTGRAQSLLHVTFLRAAAQPTWY